jgi:TP901-1 family phage major tail protein
MAIQNATNVVLSITPTGGTLEAVAHCTSASISMNMDLRDSTTKSSGGWQENLGGLKSWELSGDAFVEVSGATGADVLELTDTLFAGAAVQCTFGVSGMVYDGTALITSISIDAGVEENATYSISLTGTGELELNA